MGAPKQRWTAEEESALKAGIQKHGVGKWSVILKDPEFNPVLRSRSNVDLKDKWRNLNCMVNGLGSRSRANNAHKNNQSAPKLDESAATDSVVAERADNAHKNNQSAPKLDESAATGSVVAERANNAHKNNQSAPKLDESAATDSVVAEKDSVALDATPLAATDEIIQDATSRNKIPRLDDLIVEAITKLKEPRGSSRQAIASYIKDHHSTSPDLERDLAANLKLLTKNGRLFKVKHHYRIAPSPRSLTSGVEKVKEPLLVTNGAKKDLSEWERNGIVALSKAQIDAELEKMKSMSAKEALAAAAKAVAEAEAAIALAEAAALEAEEAEAEAEAARCFANAAQKSLKCKIIHA